MLCGASSTYGGYLCDFPTSKLSYYSWPILAFGFHSTLILAFYFISFAGEQPNSKTGQGILLLTEFGVPSQASIGLMIKSLFIMFPISQLIQHLLNTVLTEICQIINLCLRMQPWLVCRLEPTRACSGVVNSQTQTICFALISCWPFYL